MYKFVRSVAQVVDLPSGEFLHIGEYKPEDVKIKIIDYDAEQFHEKEIISMEEYTPYETRPSVTWVDVDGLSDVNIVEKIGAYFNLHNLILEDILNTGQSPIIEDFGEYIFIVLKMIYTDQSNNIISEHVSLLTGKNFVISFQESGGDVFDPVRKQIRQNKGRIRKMGAPYLAYSLLDSIVDNYFSVLQKLEEELECLESRVIKDPSQETLTLIYELKRELLFLHKSIWPLRAVLCKLQREGLSLMSEVKGIYLRDLTDNLSQVINTLETFRDMLSSMIDMHMSSYANKMNQIMKVLTIISTIFIPLGFITSLYGMEIYMPEKELHWFYPFIISIMSVIAIIMLLYFKRKKWL